MTPIERASRAVAGVVEEFSQPDPTECWDRLSQSSRDTYTLIVHAVLQALREPTKAMMDAGDEWTNHHADCVYSIWQAMIDAALAEGSE